MTSHIDIATNFLGASSASGVHLYFDEQTNDHWRADDASMAALGRSLEGCAGDPTEAYGDHHDAYQSWCEDATDDETVEFERVVLDWGLHEAGADLDAAQAEALRDGDTVAHLALRSFRPAVLEAIGQIVEAG